jgi:hypothetical protein
MLDNAKRRDDFGNKPLRACFRQFSLALCVGKSENRGKPCEPAAQRNSAGMAAARDAQVSLAGELRFTPPRGEAIYPPHFRRPGHAFPADFARLRPPTRFHSKARRKPKMRTLLAHGIAALTLVCWLSPPAVQAQGAQAAQGSQYRYYNPMGQSLYHLFNPQIQKELEIVTEQKEKLTKIRTETQEKTRGLWASFKDVPANERREKYYEAYRELGKETEKKVREVLLDDQFERLRQILLQTRMRSMGYGASSVLTGGDVAETLGLTDKQKEQIRKKEVEIRQEMQKKTQEFYKKLREEAREDLMGLLSEAQRKKLEELMGAKFEWQTRQYARGQAGAAKVEKKQ